MKKSPAILILFVWVVVLIPLAWGLYHTVLNSRPLFTAPAAPPAKSG